MRAIERPKLYRGISGASSNKIGAGRWGGHVIARRACERAKNETIDISATLRLHRLRHFLKAAERRHARKLPCTLHGFHFSGSTL